MSDNPTNYKPNLPRVSAIVEANYPFEGNSKDRFIDWLYKNDIEPSDYMKEASEGGTYVHKAMEDYANGIKPKGKLYKKYKSIVDSGIQFHKDYNPTLNQSEVYIATAEYQGTLDRLCEITNDKWILDWKTYGLAKKEFGLSSTYRKPYDKLKKARLQLSLYNKALKYKYRLAVVELTEDGYYFHELVPYTNKELKDFIAIYKNRYVDEL